MDALPVVWRSVLDAIVDAPTAWSTVATLAQISKIDAQAIDAALQEMQTCDWVVPLADPDSGRSCWTLSLSASIFLRVELAPSGYREDECWDSIDKRLRTRPRDRVFDDGDDGPQLPEPVDRRPSAEDVAIEREECDRKRRQSTGAIPKPTVLLEGSSLRPWLCGQEKGDCPGCHGVALPATTYCLRCDRYGLDRVIRAVRAADARRERAREAERDAAKQRERQEARQRKSRRQAKKAG